VKQHWSIFVDEPTGYYAGVRNTFAALPFKHICRELFSRFMLVLPALRPALTPGAILAATLGVWRLAAEDGWINNSVFAKGLVSHWQFWFAIALTAHCLHRLENQNHRRNFLANALRWQSSAAPVQPESDKSFSRTLHRNSGFPKPIRRKRIGPAKALANSGLRCRRRRSKTS
jgi:hypothetical protein